MAADHAPRSAGRRRSWTGGTLAVRATRSRAVAVKRSAYRRGRVMTIAVTSPRLVSCRQAPSMSPGAARDALTLVAGVVTGVLSGAFGVGGAVISTPAVRALGASALLAVGTTLPSIFPSALTGTVRYTREHLVDWSIVIWTAPYGLVAAVGGSLLSHAVPGHGHVLMLLTAGLIGFTALRMVRTPDKAASDAARARMTAGPGAAETWDPPHPDPTR